MCVKGHDFSHLGVTFAILTIDSWNTIHKQSVPYGSRYERSVILTVVWLACLSRLLPWVAAACHEQCL